MKVLRGDHAEWEPVAETALSIGVYDGVHRGHRAVLERLVAEAREQGLLPAVLTFDPHPMAVIAPQRAPEPLTTIERRLELLAECGIEVVAVAAFDRRMREMAPDTFGDLIVRRALGARVVVVGRDFRFGRDRAGDAAVLRDLGFPVVDVPLVADGTTISSSEIRRLILAGEVEEAARLLGRCHEVGGVVRRGDGRGMELGFPTANLDDIEVVIPAKGVYAGWARLEEGTVPAAISVGIRPTFETDRTLVVEGYLLDFRSDLYGRTIELSFCHRLRDEEKFESVTALVEQMERDVRRTRELLRRQTS